MSTSRARGLGPGSTLGLGTLGPGTATALLVTVVLTWLVGYPLGITLVEALRDADGPTLDFVREFASRPDEWRALWRSVWISLASVGLAALVGIPLAALFALGDFPGRRVMGALVPLPVTLPPLVGVIAFLFLFGESGFLSRLVQLGLGLERPPWRLHGPGAILLVHTYSMYVYFYLFVRAALERLDRSQIEAARLLGAGRARIALRVVLPQLRHALLGAALLTFMTSLGSFSAPYIFAGGWRVMTTQIVASKLSGQLALAQVEAVVLASVAFLGLALIRRLQGPDTALSGHGVAPGPRRSPRPAVRRLMTGISVVVTVAVLLPHLTLVLISLVPSGTWTVELLPPSLSFENYRDLVARPDRLRPLLNSLWMASVATAGAVALGFVAARRAVAAKGRIGGWLEGLVSLPWAVPGTVFAVALAATFGVHAPWLGRFVWVGTPIILPLAYLVRCLPLTGRAALAGLRGLDPALEEASAVLGAGRIRTLVRVVLPAIRPALLAGVGLAFITALGDFVTSIVLYTYETRPISIEIASALRVQEFGFAAAYGVVLMALSGAAFLIWGRGEARL